MTSQRPQGALGYFGSAVLGALFERRKLSTTTLGRAAIALEPVTVKPRNADVEVRRVVLAWAPVTE